MYSAMRGRYTFRSLPISVFHRKHASEFGGDIRAGGLHPSTACPAADTTAKAGRRVFWANSVKRPGEREQTSFSSGYLEKPFFEH